MHTNAQTLGSNNNLIDTKVTEILTVDAHKHTKF